MTLDMENITVQFGGNTALSEVSLKIGVSSITGLIGPNGAGKSTAINVLGGFIQPNKGRVVFNGIDLTNKSIQTRARHGIGRTFQQVKLCEESSIRENLMYAGEALLAGSNPVRLVVGRRGDLSMMKKKVDDALELCGLKELENLKVEDLSTGQRRLVELSRCIVNEYQMILLDEPAAGLDERETGSMGELLGKLVKERGVGVLLVEHDMSLVLSICHGVYVLDFGRIIYSGSAEEVKNSALVQEAYLGVI